MLRVYELAPSISSFSVVAFQAAVTVNTVPAVKLPAETVAAEPPARLRSKLPLESRSSVILCELSSAQEKRTGWRLGEEDGLEAA